MRALQRHGYSNVVTRSHAVLDLVDQTAVREFFAAERPEYVFLAAAKVGGILANSIYPAEFIHQNLCIQTNVIHESWHSGVKRLLFLGSSCIYPRDCPQPIKEEYLLTGPLEETNKAYALAKIAGIEMCASYNQQYGTQYLCAMPSNLYGIGDNYDLQSSHVLAALMRKAHEAKIAGARAMTVWGTGTPRREFLISDDLAEACILLNTSDWARLTAILPNNKLPLINIGCGEDVTIAKLAELVAKEVGFTGDIDWDRSKPDCTPQKLLDILRVRELGWARRVSLKEGISMAYKVRSKSEWLVV